MKCTYCQYEYDETLGSCPICNTQASQYQAQNGVYSPTAVEIIKKVGQSKLFLIATILYTLAYAISYISSGELPSVNILMAVGLWMFYAECAKKNSNPYEMKTTAFTVMNVAQTIIYVICWIGAVALAVCLFMFVAMYGELKSALGSLSLFVDVVIAVCVVGIILLAAEIILRKGIKNYIKRASESAKTGLRPKKLSKFTPVFLIVYSIVGIVSAIVINVVLYLFVDKVIDVLSQFMNSVSSASNIYMTYNAADLNINVEAIYPSFLTVITSIVTAILPISAQLIFAFVMLDAKELSDSSYYPTEEELFYQRQACYASAYAGYEAPQYQDAPYQAQPQYQHIPVSTQATDKDAQSTSDNAHDTDQ